MQDNSICSLSYTCITDKFGVLVTSYAVYSNLIQSFCRILLSAIALLSICAADAHAQPIDTVTVRANSPQVFRGTYNHWQQAEYNWTVRGGGSVGNVFDNVELSVDARFSLVSLDLPGGIEYPKLPLNDNPAFGFLCGGPLLPQSSCNVYLACNAPEDNAHLMEPMVLSEADAMKTYAFRPDNDVKNDSGTYFLTVAGNDIKPEFMFIDRYEHMTGNIFYQDNVTLGAPTEFHVVTRRISPELVVVDQAGMIINDGPPGSVPDEVVRSVSLDFGMAPVQGPRLTYSRVLSNRGLNGLEIDSIAVLGNTNAFDIVRGDGLPLGQFKQLRSYFEDSLALSFRFVPQQQGDFAATVRVYCNDPTQNANSDLRWFEFNLKGQGIAPGLAIDTVQNTDVVLNHMDMGLVRVGDNKGATLFVRSSGQAGVNGLRIVHSPGIPFSIASSWNGTTDLPVDAEETIQVDFSPTSRGKFQDSIVLQSDNIGRVVIHLHAVGLQAEATIFQESRPSFELELVDTIFFGNVSPNSSVTKTFRVRNFGNIELFSAGKVTPYYSVNQVQGSVDNFDDIGVDLDANGSVSTGSPYVDRVFSLRFVTAAESPDTDPLGVKIARIEIQFHDAFDNNEVVVRKTIYLIGARLGVTLDKQEVHFDSVAVGFTVRESVTAVNYAFEEAMISRVGMNRAFPLPTDFFVDNVVGERVLQNQPFEVPIEYTPNVIGRDSAVLDLDFQYSVDNTISVSTPVYGVGVDQTLKFLTTSVSGGGTTTNRVENDTVFIDFGEVSVCQSAKTALLVHSLEGNMPFHPEDGGQYVEQVNGFHGDFVVDRKFEDRHIQPLEKDSTFAITFRPLTSGDHRVYVTIVSDIGQRARGSEIMKHRYVYCLSGVGVQAELLLSEQEDLDFGTAVITQGCVQPEVRKVVITNPGNTLLRVDSLGISPYTHFLLKRFDPIEIPPNSSSEIEIEYNPASVGNHTAQLHVFSNAFCGDTVNLGLFGAAESAPAASLTSQPGMVLKTGTVGALPIVVDSDELVANIGARTSVIEVDVLGNPTVIQEVSFVPDIRFSQGSSAGPSVNSASGAYTVFGLTPNGVTGDTIGTISFSTFLGDESVTEVYVHQVRFLSENGCVLGTASGTPTSLTLDSICGSRVLRYDSDAEFGLSQVAPNPADGDVVIRYSVGFKTHVRIELRSLSGELVYVAAEGEHPAGSYEHVIRDGTLAAGAFVILYTADVVRETGRLIVR